MKSTVGWDHCPVRDNGPKRQPWLKQRFDILDSHFDLPKTMNTNAIKNNPAGLSFVDGMFLVSLLGLLPLIFLQALCLSSLAHFQFFPMAWGAYIYFVYSRCRLADCTSAKRSIFAYITVVASVIAAFMAVVMWSPWLAYFSGLLLIVAWSLLRLGDTRWTSLLGMTTILWLTLPLPVGYDHKLIALLQSQSSVAASTLLDCLGIIHLRGGNIIELASKRLFVDEACSGADSLYALMAICLTVVVWFRFRFSVGLLCVLMVPVWTSCSNILRLVTIAVGLDWMNVDLSHGMPHTILGLIVFLLAFAADFSFIQFVAGLIGVTRKKSIIHAEVTQNRKGLLTWSSVLTCAASLCFLCAGTYQIYALSTQTIHRLPTFDAKVLGQLASETALPKTIGNARFMNFRVEERNLDSAFGQHSHVWTYALDNDRLTISADFPFRGFHPLNICYEGAGWEQLSVPNQFEIMSKDDTSSNQTLKVFVRESDMRNEEGKYAYLLFSIFQFDGKSVLSSAKGSRGMERFEQSILEPVTYQIQTFLTSDQPINLETKEAIKKCFRDIVPPLRSSFLFLSNR